MTTFTIERLHTDADGVVTMVRWKATRTHETQTAETSGTIGLPYKSVKESDLIPFDALNETQVVAWVKSQLGEQTVAAVENTLVLMLEQKAAEIEVPVLPWAKAQEEAN